MFAHRKEVVLSSSLNAVFSALNDSFESEEGESECYVACIAGGFYRSSKCAMERRGREGIGAGHFSRHSLLSASSLILRLERRSGQQRRRGAMSLTHNFNRGGYFTCTTKIPVEIACTRIIFLIQTIILLILALSLRHCSSV